MAVATVGVIGVGAATQAIHLPTIARLPDAFRVTRVTDVDRQTAADVAAQLGAVAVESVDELLAPCPSADPNDRSAPGVDVVVICSPNQFHAEQVIAACGAGVSAVLCEKPLAVSVAESRAIAETARRTGVPIVVGTMHRFDPVWCAAERAWNESNALAHSVRLNAHIPPNPQTEDFATEVVGRRSPVATGDPDALSTKIARVRGGVLGLSIHDLPLARRLLPDAAPTVRLVQTEGNSYLILVEVGDACLELHAGSSKNWMPDWSLEAIAAERVLTADFGLSYVHAGSAVAEISGASGAAGFAATRFGPHPDNGYVEQWRFIADVVAGRQQGPDPEELAADVDFALQIADQAEALLRSEAEALVMS